ncbi:hypothetical protein [Lysobacter sp. Root690]|uniref:hypothetical protein n=1 Tax=Lysobacter sp. Root690 TaxID=1736588 RepID=UPI00138F3C31|nr:hypothetical protein [Lysobacter sp. Root690]
MPQALKLAEHTLAGCPEARHARRSAKQPSQQSAQPAANALIEKATPKQKATTAEIRLRLCNMVMLSFGGSLAIENER